MSMIETFGSNLENEIRTIKNIKRLYIRQSGKGKDILIYYPQMALAGGLGIGKVGDLDTTCRQ
jgi:hypothetical protein